VIIPERWQILATVPIYKMKNGAWAGTNITYYGFFCATAEATAVALSFFLLTASGVPEGSAGLLIASLLAACLPAARWVARLVDGKPYNFSVAGAAGVGMLILPLIVTGFEIAGLELPAAAVFAAFAIAYVLGEAIGRVACISFGCCYGKPLRDLSPGFRNLFQRFHFVFEGHTKKIAYESQLDGVAVVPIQAISCGIYLVLAFAGTIVFLSGAAIKAFLFTSTCAHSWRIVSEMLRADHRGAGKYSVYQFIAADAIAYSWAISFFLTEPVTRPHVWAGLQALWQPHVILFLQAFWLVVFWYHGKSMVTDSEILIRVREDRIGF
jgi:prolipoprotein diacylglyceryl transferase